MKWWVVLLCALPALAISDGFVAVLINDLEGDGRGEVVCLLEEGDVGRVAFLDGKTGEIHRNSFPPGWRPVNGIGRPVQDLMTTDGHPAVFVFSNTDLVSRREVTRASGREHRFVAGTKHGRRLPILLQMGKGMKCENLQS